MRNSRTDRETAVGAVGARGRRSGRGDEVSFDLLGKLHELHLDERNGVLPYRVELWRQRARQRVDSNPVAKIAERLGPLAFGLKSAKDRHELGHDLIVADIVLVLGVEPVAIGAAAQKDRIGSWSGIPSLLTWAERPTRPMSELYGRAQPLGQPVIRNVKRSSESPMRASSTSSWAEEIPGRAAAPASGDGQARRWAQPGRPSTSRTVETCSTAIPYSSSFHASICGRHDGSRAASKIFC